MKKAIKYFSISFIILLGLLIAIPFIFKGKIVSKVKEEANKTINAKIDFGDFDLSLIRNFPNFSLRINELSIINQEPFEGDTLVYAKQLDLTIDIMSVISGKTISIQKVLLKNPKLYFLVNENGKANWDIAKSTESKSPTSEPSTFHAALEKYSIENGTIVYNDKTMPFFLKLENVNHTGKGDFTKDIFTLNTKTLVEKGNMSYGGLTYVSNAKADILADIEINMKTMRFTFLDNKILLNELALDFSGWVMMPDSNIDMDLKFSAAKTDFKNLISIIPAVYSPQFKDLKSSGKIGLNGSIKGRYNSKSMPGFGINLTIENGMFQYPTLPSSVNNVNLVLAITNLDGIPDHTIIDLSKFHIEVNKDPFDAKLYLATPISDPSINAFMKGKIDLAGIQKLVPLEKGTELTGIITADVSLKGKMSSIEQKKYDQFMATGNFGITSMIFSNSSMKQPLNISTLQMSFNPSVVSLQALNAKIGGSDFNMTGAINNFLAYALKDETIHANLSLTSAQINLNEFITGETSASGNVDTSKMAVLDVPGNVDFTMNTKIGKIIYQNLTLSNVEGKLEIKDKSILVNDVIMQLMGGSMKMSGKYSSVIPAKPNFNFGLAISNFDIGQTVKSFESIQKLVPIAKNCSGNFSTGLNVQGDLDQKMSPVMNTLSGAGKLTTSTVVVDNFPAFVKIADVLKLSSWKKLSVPPVSPSFKFLNGRVFVDPFDVTINGIKATIGGSNGFDQTIDYTMATQIPRAAFGSAANSVIGGLLSTANSKGANVSLGDVIPVNLTISGTVENPKIGTDLNKAGTKVMDDLKAKAAEEFNKKKDELESKAREEANKIKNQSEQKLNEEKQKAGAEADRIKKETEAKAKSYSDSLKREAEKKAKDQLKNLNPFKK